MCQQCGRESLRWLGRCPGCQQWSTFVERVHSPVPATAAAPALPRELSAIRAEAVERLNVPVSEFNRVLGGGLVPGSLVLLAGDPGIGKSTLLLQVSAALCGISAQVVYVCGEETPEQVKLRAKRLGLSGEGLYLLPETDLETVLASLGSLEPVLIVADSIQTLCLPGVESSAGSVTQVRECTQRLMRWAKQNGVPVLIAGHVTKDGAIAGPRVLEHIVDVVLYLEGEAFSAYRLLHCTKNRFGSVNEVGVFEMREDGLAGVDNPSRAFLAQRGEKTAGSAVVPVLEGSRPLLVEIQALTSPTAFGMPRRTANGVEFERLLIIAAVLAKRVGLRLGNQDIIVNAAGGLRVREPAADLGIALAIASSFRDQEIDPKLVVMGEVGLGGELRGVPQLERRVAESARLGFERCLVPKTGARISPPEGIKIITAATLAEAVMTGLRHE